MPVDPSAQRADENVRLAQAPTNPKDFHALAVGMAEILIQRPAATRGKAPLSDGAEKTSSVLGGGSMAPSKLES
jgi:hypothetical protein